MGKWETEDEDHNTWRKLVAPSFTAKRIDSLSSAIQEMIDRLLDQMAEMTPPVDFHELVSFPLPVQVVGRLLGFPPDRSHELGSWCDAMAALQDPEKSAAGLAALRDYAGQLLQIKREQPGDDVFSDLVAASAVEPRLEQRATGLAARLLFAGHETTVSMIDAGLVHLLTKPDQRAAVLRDPSIASNTIEEILRYAFPSQDVLLRYARSELEVDGARIKPGDLVLLNIQAANHDDKVFYDPSHFDIDRRHNPHLAFGYGRHYCIGSSLARLELRIVLLTVLRRFPSLRLAIPPEELRLRDDLFTGGLQALPVAW
jgi:pentalenolactone synthase